MNVVFGANKKYLNKLVKLSHTHVGTLSCFTVSTFILFSFYWYSEKVEIVGWITICGNNCYFGLYTEIENYLLKLHVDLLWSNANSKIASEVSSIDRFHHLCVREI